MAGGLHAPTVAVVLCALFYGAIAASSAPHIVFILADDLGWNDVSYHGSAQIPTPNLDRLAAEGVTLNNYYVNPVCSPTRASLMSGRATIHHGIVQPWGSGCDSCGLNISYTILPQHLKAEYNYATYMVGKWHVGEKAPMYLPAARGFDKYFGYHHGIMDYWGHYEDQGFGPKVKGLDLFAHGYNYTNHTARGAQLPDEPVYGTYGDYSTFMFSNATADIVAEHAKQQPNTPMFLYLAFQAGHSANNNYLQAPKEYLDKFDSISKNATCGQYEQVGTGDCTLLAARKSVAAIVSALDDAVGNVVQALQNAGMWENTLLIFSSDNGGPTDGADSNNMNNFPLRGCKGSFFEGGVRANGFVHGAGLKKTGYVNNQMVHITDWLPSLLTAAKRGVTGDPAAHHSMMRLGIQEVPWKDGDGIDVWDAISSNAQSPRTEIIHSAQATGSVLTAEALRVGDLKLVMDPGMFDCGVDHLGWYPPTSLQWNYTRFSVQCSEPPTIFNCTHDKPCLFNITADPCEHMNLAEQLPQQLAALQTRLAQYRKTTVLSFNNYPHGTDPRSNPENFGPITHEYSGVWLPWMTDAEDIKWYPTNYSGPGY